jgi:hypothetical protein
MRTVVLIAYTDSIYFFNEILFNSFEEKSHGISTIV